MKNKDTSSYNKNDMAAILGGAVSSSQDDIWGSLANINKTTDAKTEDDAPVAKTKKTKKKKKTSKAPEEATATTTTKAKKSKKRKASAEPGPSKKTKAE